MSKPSEILIDGLNGWRHLAFDTITSTNAIALEYAQNGDAGRLWVTALEQTAGRGRRNRVWVSKPGNLYASLLLVDSSLPEAPPESLTTLPLVTSLALHKALVTARPQLAGELKIKWPNDLLLGGKKLSGILLEAIQYADGRRAVVIGIGVNCKHYPDNPLYPAISLEEYGAAITDKELFAHIAKAMADELLIWAGGAGFSIIRKEWLERATGIGAEITARFSDHELVGKFIDLDEDGFLLLEDERNIQHKISSADIFFGNTNTIGA